MTAAQTVPVHATCVAFGNDGVLIIGKSGAGKSGLALQLMALGGELVADDGVMLDRVGDNAMATAPAALRGKIEIRGIGVLEAAYRQAARLKLVVDLDRPPLKRLPESRSHAVCGVDLPLITGKDVPNLAAAIIVMLRNQ